jgi:hypothetical protein
MPKHPSTAVTIRGVTYPSIGIAAAALRITPSAIHIARRQDRLDTVGLRPAVSAATKDLPGLAPFTQDERVRLIKVLSLGLPAPEDRALLERAIRRLL